MCNVRNIGIFCSSSNKLDAIYYEEADRLGRWIGEHGLTLVYGGANCGFMEAMVKADTLEQVVSNMMESAE